ncbi:MAG: glutaredoxin family protein [Algiphilus sp.]|uniref:glutaredoxin family protein n=1 Tax=Algiphilus sp. TaxID=1872431 RepID=UPI0032EDCEE9
MIPRLLTRPGCCLCDSFHEEWRAAFPGVGLDAVDIDRWPELRAVYGARIPVLLDGSDAVVCEGRFDRETCAALVEALKERR